MLLGNAVGCHIPIFDDARCPGGSGELLAWYLQEWRKNCTCCEKERVVCLMKPSSNRGVNQLNLVGSWGSVVEYSVLVSRCN